LPLQGFDLSVPRHATRGLSPTRTGFCPRVQPSPADSSATEAAKCNATALLSIFRLYSAYHQGGRSSSDPKAGAARSPATRRPQTHSPRRSLNRSPESGGCHTPPEPAHSVSTLSASRTLVPEAPTHTRGAGFVPWTPCHLLGFAGFVSPRQRFRASAFRVSPPGDPRSVSRPRPSLPFHTTLCRCARLRRLTPPGKRVRRRRSSASPYPPGVLPL
jgi:hypothetical protein